MPISFTGSISFSDLQTNFGGTDPISLSEYYSGGGLVPTEASGKNGIIPNSSAISMSQFYGANLTPTLNSNLTTDNTFNGVERYIWRSFPASGAYIGYGTLESYSPTMNTLTTTSLPNSTTSLTLHSGFYTVTTYCIPPSCNSITIHCWGGGGGSGGSWNTSSPGDGGAGGYATTVLYRSNGDFFTGDFLHIAAGYPGAGARKFFESGSGGGSSFCWITSTYPVTVPTNINLFNTINTTNLVLVAGGGGGGGGSNVFSGYGGGSGGSGGSLNSGSNNNGSVSGSGSGATQSAHGSASIGPYAGELGAGAIGGAIGSVSGSANITTLGESALRNLIVTERHDIRASTSDTSNWASLAGGGCGVYCGASGCSPLPPSATYGYSSRGGGGGSSKVYKGSGSVYNSGISYVPYSAEGSRGYGGAGKSSGNGIDGNGYPIYAGVNGTGGRVRLIFST